MAIIHVGPKEGYKKYEGAFSPYGHYLVVSDVDEKIIFMLSILIKSAVELIFLLNI